MFRRLVPIAALLAACDPLANTFEPVSAVRSDRTYAGAGKSPAAAPTGDTLNVMTWNVKFAGGRIDFWFDCFGDRNVMTRAEVDANMNGLIAKIKQSDPDVLLLQECDVGSFRVAGVDMMRRFVDETSLGYGVYASHWRSQFIPVNNLRNMDSGNAILAKWPLTNATRYQLPLRGDADALYRQFYLKRNMLVADLDVPGKRKITLVNVHTEAYAKDGTKKRHIEQFEAKVKDLAARGRVVAGGDLNSVPPGTTKVKDFPDQVCKDPDFPPDQYGEEVEWLRDLYTTYDAAIPLADYVKDNSPWYSYTADKNGAWNRTLDHLFTNGKFKAGSGVMHQDAARGGMATLPLSDHAPLSAELDLSQ
ncbi:MAG: endonuclease/exonuclease/phosphatase family protein [Candidatus Sericytochromatia bacterium]|nr:endonuclease/exonuclease/phosphatase family protein [Candidatus Tanganyikabacteria bacterium]